MLISRRKERYSIVAFSSDIVYVPNECDLQGGSRVNTELALTHYQTTNFRLPKLKEFADDSFKFDENGRKLSKR